MSQKDESKSDRGSKIVATVLVILALIAVAVLVLKQDDCFPDPEPEPVPCSGEHCPVKGEATAGAVIVNPGSTGTGGKETDAEPAGSTGKIDAVPLK